MRPPVLGAAAETTARFDETEQPTNIWALRGRSRIETSTPTIIGDLGRLFAEEPEATADEVTNVIRLPIASLLARVASRDLGAIVT